jgi:radical SAM superfamily enzyme YgiQ (UPF0313 family)
MTKKYDCVIFTDNANPLVAQKALGAYKVAHILRQHGYSCLVIDHLHFFTIEELHSLLELCISDQTKFVGFSTGFFSNIENIDIRIAQQFGVMNFNKSFFPQGKDFENQFLQKLKQLNSNCKIVLGGPQIMLDQLSNKNVNYVVVGYAEVSVISLMQHLESGQSLDNSYKNLYGVVIVDDRTASGYDFKTCTMHWLPEDVMGTRVLPIEISRGCIFNCKYCQYPMRGKKGNDFLRSSDLIRDELQYNYDNYGVETYYILDDTFNDNDEKLDSMLEAVQQLTFKPIFWCYARLDLFYNKPERVDKVYNIGVRSMFLGIETFNREAGTAIGKGMHAHKQTETLRYIRNKYGNDLLLHGNFIIGLPGETEDSIKNTVQMIISGEAPLHTVLFPPLRIFKGSNWWSSEIDLNYEKFGYKEISNENNQLSELYNRFNSGINADFLAWDNGTMTYQDALRISQESFKATNHIRYLPNYAMWEMIDHGHKFDELKELKATQMDPVKLRGEKFKKISKYKTNLFKMLTTESK